MASDTAYPAVVPSDAYLELIRAFPLKPIESDSEHVRAIEIVDSIDDRRDSLLPGELDYFLVLCFLIEQYETKIYGEPGDDDGNQVEGE